MASDKIGQFLTAAAFMLAIAGALLLLVVPKDDHRRRGLGFGFFVGGMAGIAMFFLMENPDVMKSAQEHIALTLIGMVIAFFSVLHHFKK